MIESERKQILWKRSLTILTIVCIGAYLLVFAVMNIFGFPLFCDTDMYADTTVSRLIWEQKSLFPEGWIFSNQYYVVATPVFAALFYGITGNTNTAMILATELMTLFIFLSFLWVVRSFTGETLVYLAGILMLMASVIAPDIPDSWTAQLFFLQASYYSCYLITLFVVLGDYIRSCRSPKLRPVMWIFSLFLSFATGMQSLRQTVVMVLPILVCELFQALRRMLLHEKPWTRRNVGSLARAVSYGAANLAGLLTTAWVDPPHSLLYGSVQLTPWNQLWARFPSVFHALGGITGLRDGFGDSISPFFALFSLFLVALFAAAFVLWLLRIRKPETPLTLCWLVCLAGVIGVCLSTIVTDTTMRTIYLFIWYPLAAFSALVVIQKLPFKPKCLILLLICLFSIGNLFHGYIDGAELALQNDQSRAGKAFRLAQDYGYDTQAQTDEDFADASALARWAREEGYEYVYGDWFTAPRIAVHSGGSLAAGCWWKTGIYCPLGYLNLQNIYGPAENEKAIYVFTPEDEADGLRLALEEGVVLTKAAEFGKYAAYTSPVPLMYQKPNSYE